MTQLKMEKGEKAQGYWGRIEVLRRDLRACGASVEDEEWLCATMSGLPSDWGSVLATLDVAHLNEAALEARLLDEQDRRACAKTVADGMLNSNKGYSQGGRGNGRGMRNLGRGGYGSGFGGAQGRGDYGGQRFGRGGYGRGQFQGRGQGFREQGEGWMRDQKQGGQGGEMRAPDMAPRGHCHFCKIQGHGWKECRKRLSINPNWVSQFIKEGRGKANVAEVKKGSRKRVVETKNGVGLRGVKGRTHSGRWRRSKG